MSSNQSIVAAPMNSTAVGDEVRLIRCGQHLHVEPPCLEILQILHTRWRTLATNREGRSVVFNMPWPMFMMKEPAGVPTPLYTAGLERAIRRLLERSGYKARVVRRQERGNRMVGVVDPPADILPTVAPADGRSSWSARPPRPRWPGLRTPRICWTFSMI